MKAYTYDNVGNLQTAENSTGTHTYTYGHVSWDDLLTKYDGETISYDAIGNPTSYYNGTRWTMTWQNGRQLATATDGTSSVSYEYDQQTGLRLTKTVGSTKYSYYYAGGKLLRMTIGSDTVMDFFYDQNGDPYAMNYNGTLCYYITNLQGDVVRIVNSAGDSYGIYKYDAWGNILYSSDTAVIQANPLRYRGYIYDTETGFYYCQSRYYDPKIGRWLNADSYASTGQGFVGYNMFAYCNNNPVTGADPTGHWNWGKFFSGANLLMVGISAVAVAATVLTCGAAAPAMMAVAAVTFAAGAATAVNGIAEIVEAGTGYNVVRDGVLGGNEELYEAQKAVNSGVAQAGSAVLGGYTAAKGGSVCFVAGTLVLAAVGRVAIEEIEAGDMVWSWDEETGDVALKEVVETYVNETDELIHVFTNGEEIITTPEHPFYSPKKGWTSAAQLCAGDILVTVNGDYVVVEAVQHELLETRIKVYNFQVEDYHTYYVSDTGVLVHNSCGGESSATKRGRKMHKNWNYGPGVLKEQTIGAGARVDGIDLVDHIIYELKPNNPRAIKLGLKQLDRYLAIAGKDWAGVLVLYD